MKSPRGASLPRGVLFSDIEWLSYLRDFLSFAILIARTFFIIRRKVALSAADKVVFTFRFINEPQLKVNYAIPVSGRLV